MPLDLSRVASKALEAALEDGRPRHRHSQLRTLAAGAALAVAARAAVSRTPHLLRHLPDLHEWRDIPDRVRDRMADAGWLDDEQDVDEPEAEYAEEEEPEAEFDEPEDEPDDDEDLEEDEDLDEDEPQAEAEEDEDLEDDDDESEPPELELESEDDEDLHPEDRPPKPPRSKATSRR